MTNSSGHFERVRLILLREWDPLFAVKRQRYDESHEDEYDGYAREIANMLKRGSSYDEILAYLKWAETENMGLSYSEEKADRAARLIVDSCHTN